MKANKSLFVIMVLLVCGLFLSAEIPASKHKILNAADNELLQFTSFGQVLAFRAGSVLMAAGDHAVKIGFVGAYPVQPRGESAAADNTKGTSTQEKVTYSNLWSGIDLVYEKTLAGVMKSSYVVAPGADPGIIRLLFNAPVRITADGELAIRYASGEYKESKPVAWQERNGVRKDVSADYRKVGEQEIGFSVSGWDGRSTLVIDPVSMWNTFLGGSAVDYGNGIAVDGSNNIFVAGYSSSTWGSPLNPHSGDFDAFVAKLDMNGTLQWSTFLGGSGYDSTGAIALDSDGNIYVFGGSDSTWGSPLNPYNAGVSDVFVAKLNESGALQWNTFFGGSDSDGAKGMVVDGDGNICLAGYSYYSSWGSPLRPFAGYVDAFVAKLNANGALQWNTFLGSSSIDDADAIAVDGSNNIYVSGMSDYTWGSTLNSHSGGRDVLVAKLDANGALQWHTFQGSGGRDEGYGIAVDNSGNIHVAGYSTSAWGSPLNPYSGGNDAFVTKFNASGELQWNTFLGGSGSDIGFFIDVDGSGDLNVIGYSNATWGSPSNPYSGGNDAFVAKLNGSGARQWNTFLGGSGDDQSFYFALGGSGGIYVEGFSSSTWGSPLRAHSGNYDAFVAKLGYLITGTITSGGSPLAGVVMSGLPGNPTTNSSGVYTATVDFNWSGTATPVLAGYAFSPGNRIYNVVTSDLAGQDYAATLLPAYTISGTITSGGSPMTGVVLSGLPGAPSTDGSGFYAATVAYGWSGTVTPTLAGYVFTPVTRTYSAVSFDQTAQDYTAAVFTSIPQSEREALIALYNSTNGDAWTDNSGWKTPTLHSDGFALPGTENTWYGVTIDSGNTIVRELHLDENNLVGTIPASLGNLGNLQYLNFYNNQLTGAIPPELGSLSNLQHLDLWLNQLTGTIPPELGNLSNLSFLDLGENLLNGTIPAELGNLSAVEGLWLNNNQLSGNIPATLGNLSNLTHLGLADNLLTGSIPPELGNLSSLNGILWLYNNQLSGSIPPELGNLTKLKNLTLGANQLTGSIPPELGNMTQLEHLGLTGNQLTGSIPPELGSLSNLNSLYLNSNQLSGSIPSELGNLSKLQQLNLGSNQLTGSISPELGNLTELIELLLNINQLTGSIPVEIGNLSNLIYLCLNKNQLTGNIPPELGNLNNLQILLLNLNQLSGTIPLQLGNLNHLEMLLLNSNQLTGTIPTSLGNLSNLQLLWFNSNQLSGSIPIELGNLGNLTELWLSSNQLTGTIPSELGNLSNLQYLALDSNQHTGSIPAELGNLSNLQLLWLNSNQLSGTVPTSLKGLSMLHMSLLDIGYNALYTSDANLISFLNGKDVDWASTQTIAPANIAATPVNSTTISMTWDAIPYSGDTGGYRVSVGTTSGGPYTFFQQTIDKTTTSLPVTGLNHGTPYYFVISTRTDAHANNQNVVGSENSAEASTTTIPVHTVTFVEGSGGTISGTKVQTVEHGSNCTEVEAVPGSGYHFVYWTGDYSGTTNPLTITNVTANMNITANFAIDAALNLTSPDGGEYWTLEATQNITWTATNYSGTVRLVLFRNGAKLGNVATGLSAAAGSYSWTVGQYSGGTAPAGTGYRMYLRSTDNTLVDASDTWFNLIASAQLQVTSPNGGESWVSGSQHNITWNANGYSGTVRLILFSNTAKKGQIAAGIPAATGTYLWTVGVTQYSTVPPGEMYSVRLLAADSSQQDYSDSPFAITASGAMVADHRHTEPGGIPAEWLDRARWQQRLLVMSAGKNDTAALGLRLLGSLDPRLGVATGAASAYMDLALHEAIYQPKGIGFDLQEWRWSLEQAALESGATVVLMKADEAALRSGRLNAAGYISVLRELADRLPKVKLVCSTVGMDKPDNLLERFNRQVREYVLQTNGVLLDTADIESWHGNEQAVQDESPVRHAAYREDSCQQPCAENLKRQGAAMWWLLARLAGREGIASSSISPTSSR